MRLWCAIPHPSTKANKIETMEKINPRHIQEIFSPWPCQWRNYVRCFLTLWKRKKKKQKQKKTIHNNYLLQQFYSVQTPSYIQLINSAVLSSLQNRLPEIFCKKWQHVFVSNYCNYYKVINSLTCLLEWF